MASDASGNNPTATFDDGIDSDCLYDHYAVHSSGWYYSPWKFLALNGKLPASHMRPVRLLLWRPKPGLPLLPQPSIECENAGVNIGIVAQSKQD